MELDLHVAAPRLNDTVFALFNQSLSDCSCTAIPKLPKSAADLDFHAWHIEIFVLTLFLFLIIEIWIALYLLYVLQRSSTSLQRETATLKKYFRRVDAYERYNL